MSHKSAKRTRRTKARLYQLCVARCGGNAELPEVEQLYETLLSSFAEMSHATQQALMDRMQASLPELLREG